ncbi:hypothetical protein SAMN05519103_01923 [Rhizobiales bacterium GAS113]|nr:hypothetical protein SAMN05519103_01923 [Rhizobiales bacterium GAS113]
MTPGQLKIIEATADTLPPHLREVFISHAALWLTSEEAARYADSYALERVAAQQNELNNTEDAELNRE